MKRSLSAFIPFIPALFALGCSNSISDSGSGGAPTGTVGGGSSQGGSGIDQGGASPVAGGSSAEGGSLIPVGGANTGGGDSGGGSPIAGSSSGGTGGGGAGAPQGGGSSGGPAGGTGGGAAGAPATITISSTADGAFNNSFMITACGAQGSGYDCPNSPPGGNCSSAKWSYMSSTGAVSTQEATGISSDQVFTVTGGDPAKIYDVTVHVVGQAEGRTYVNGMLHGTNIDPGKENNDMLYTGGQPGPDRVDYNVFQLTITGGTPIPGAAAYYAFNATTKALEGQHHNYSVDETFTMKVKSGMKLTFTNHDSNCISIKNCGSGAAPYGFANAAACEARARTTPAGVTLPATFHGITITNPQRFQTQFLNFKVTNIVAE